MTYVSIPQKCTFQHQLNKKNHTVTLILTNIMQISNGLVLKVVWF
uniref:Uncharacterized protein n=1 Tax=Anguilla anguilla TaxID=7936 RepID=A0A0E9Q198_ANGAN